MIEMDRWVYKLSGAPEETIVRKSTDSFLTDRIPVDQWSQFGDYYEVNDFIFCTMLLIRKL
jgi:hypothetical protein